ncbi:hypothetical protein LUZ60_017539 [Juncus effusus]|nr:hypothetical protein LUZ60_017539 [Juncus effusus]
MMKLSIQFILTLLICSAILSNSSSLEDLSTDFYAFSCPNVELFVRDTVRTASAIDGTVPGKLLRLVFHDCMVEGCDGSVLVKGNRTERTDPANLSLGGFEVVESAKRLLEDMCPGTVSCADIVVLAARDAVAITGGPSVQVPLGRKDGLVSLASNVRPNIVDTSFSVDAMAKVFSSKGLSMDDLVILSGGHTIGLSHCSSFNDRFQQDSNGSLVLVDNSLDKNYALELTQICNASAKTTVSCDSVTPNLFDNQYYLNLLNGRGLFQTDSVLANNSKTKDLVATLAQDQDSFFNGWADSFIRMTSMGVKTGEDEGEIRAVCSSVND